MPLRNYKPKAGFFEKLAVSHEIRGALREVAEKAKAYAKSISPDAPPIGEGYISSFQVTDETITDWTGKYKTPRAAARLTNTSGHAAAVEWGYRGRKAEESRSAHRVLGRTLDALKGL